MSLTTREKLIRSGYDLFYRQGFHAAGLDQIIRSAGVTKSTFYNHFDSKETLILEVMKWRSAIWPERLRENLLRRAGVRPRAQLMALFDVLDEAWGTAGYHGCLFVRAAAEFPLPHDPVHVVAHDFVRQLKAAVRELAAFAGARKPKVLADELLVLMAGAYAQSQMDDPSTAARIGKRMTRRLLRQSLPRTRSNHRKQPVRLEFSAASLSGRLV